MRLFLTTIVLALFAQPIWAKTVFYCSQTSSAIIDANGVATNPEIKLLRFKMAIDDQQVQFSGAKMFEGGEWVPEVINGNRFTARAFFDWQFADSKETLRLTYSVAHFDGTNLYLSRYGGEWITIFHAQCDKF